MRTRQGCWLAPLTGSLLGAVHAVCWWEGLWWMCVAIDVGCRWVMWRESGHRR